MVKCDWCPPKCYTQFPKCFKRYPGSCLQKNPGNILELHARAHRIMPKFFDGLELDYLNRIAANKVFTCNWMLSHTRPAGFRFGGIYNMRLHGDDIETPTIHANMNPATFASNVGILYYPFKCLRVEAAMQRAAKDSPLQTQTTIELIRPCSNLMANFYDVSSESGRITMSFMRTITEHWAMGAELLLEWNEPKSVMADTAFAARYSHHNYSIASTASRQGLDVSYWQRIHDRIQMASMLAWHRKTERAIATVCYQWNFDEAFVQGMLDSDLSVGFMYQRTCSHIPLSFAMSLLLSLPTDRFIFGLKFTLDPSGLKRGD